MTVGATLFARVLQAFEKRHGNRMVTQEFVNRMISAVGDLEREYIELPPADAILPPTEDLGNERRS